MRPRFVLENMQPRLGILDRNLDLWAGYVEEIDPCGNTPRFRVWDTDGPEVGIVHSLDEAIRVYEEYHKKEELRRGYRSS